VNVRDKTTAYLSLGSNLGDRLALLQATRQALHGIDGLTILASSPIYQTEPVGGPAGQGLYFNAVLAVETSLEAEELLKYCLATEEQFGRRRQEPWGPRTIDIDILFFGEEVRADQVLVTPHPRIHLRGFVLIPLFHLAPDLIHPVLGRPIRELLAGLPDTEGISLFAEKW
jgi:2-amino-4-hydroxy-6-hydroxymethyldihydropteridine diphosphokinase